MSVSYTHLDVYKRQVLSVFKNFRHKNNNLTIRSAEVDSVMYEV